MALIAVVIPSFKVRDHILGVIGAIGSEVSRIYVVDDKCPEESGLYVEEQCRDPRVSVIHNPTNLGVGGAVVVGWRQAIQDGMEIIVKIDGDGQMDPRLIRYFSGPIEKGIADYTKGNRFFSSAGIKAMPPARLWGNAMLSLITKASSGYWNVVDPTNGYVAIHAKIAGAIELDKLSRRYFFESDVMFHLGKIRARILDIPLAAMYGDEISNLKISKILPEFISKNVKNTFKRLIYIYFLRNFSIGSVSLITSILFLITGVIWALGLAVSSNLSGVPTSTGALVSCALILIFGFQLLLLFLAQDISSSPDTAVHPLLADYLAASLQQEYPGRGQSPDNADIVKTQTNREQS